MEVYLLETLIKPINHGDNNDDSWHHDDNLLPTAIQEKVWEPYWKKNYHSSWNNCGRTLNYTCWGCLLLEIRWGLFLIKKLKSD